MTGLQDHDEHLAGIRALTNREPPPYPDLREDLAIANAEIERLGDRLILREGEIRGRDAANRILGKHLAEMEQQLNELSAERQGSRQPTGGEVPPSEEIHETHLTNQVDAEAPVQPAFCGEGKLDRGASFNFGERK